jgi:hypothetical protein
LAFIGTVALGRRAETRSRTPMISRAHPTRRQVIRLGSVRNSCAVSGRRLLRNVNAEGTNRGTNTSPSRTDALRR